MGAALLTPPNTAACDIIRTLRANLSIPISAKIRLLDSMEETIALIHRLEEAGVSFITVCKYVNM